MNNEPVSAQRLHSLDAFRGLDIILMFLVNAAGHDPAFPGWFAHRGWNEGAMGNGLADFVFPWFLFIVGASLPFSLSSGRGKGRSTPAKLLAALRRSVVIYLLGTLLWCATIGYTETTPITVSVFRHWDILPLIALGYLIAAVLEMLPMWCRVGAVVLILAFKWASLTMVVHPSLGAVTWTQTDSFDHYLKARWGWWGVLMTQGLAAAAIVAMGAMASNVLRLGDARRGALAVAGASTAKASGLLMGAGLAVSSAAAAWHMSGNLPFSKDFLTSSYALYMAGTGAIVLGAMHYVVDVRGWTRLTPLRVMGLNAIAMYIAAEFVWKTVLMKWNVAIPGGGGSVVFVAMKAWFHHWTNATVGSWLAVGSYIAAYWLFAYWLYRRGWFVRI